MVINDDDVDDDDDSKSHVCVSDAELFHIAHKLVDLYATSAVCQSYLLSLVSLKKFIWLEVNYLLNLSNTTKIITYYYRRVKNRKNWVPASSDEGLW